MKYLIGSSIGGLLGLMIGINCGNLIFWIIIGIFLGFAISTGSWFLEILLDIITLGFWR